MGKSSDGPEICQILVVLCLVINECHIVFYLTGITQWVKHTIRIMHIGLLLQQGINMEVC